MTAPIKSCDYVELSDLIPEGWDWWHDAFGDAPWSFGDSNRTLITADRMLAYFNDTMRDNAPDEIPAQELEEFGQMLERLGITYIDLEN